MRLLLLVALLFSSLLCYTQHVYKATSLTLGTRLNPDYDFDWSDTDYGMSIPIHTSKDNVITIYSKTTQIYYLTTGVTELEDRTLTWKAIDSQGDNCTMYMMEVDKHIFLFIEFFNVGWYYEITKY